MKTIRFALATTVVLGLAGLAYVAQQAEAPGAAMTSAAQAFLGSLSADQQKQATFPYDSPERTNWNFIPLQDKNRKSTRKGLPLEAMTAEQKQKAVGLVKAACSQSGAETAQTIMSLEGILRDQEKPGGNVRSPEWYFFTIFGTPSKTGAWGFRIEGHHLSINVALDGTAVVASTPFFFGANPAIVKGGPSAGKKVLGPSQDLAAQLFASLTVEQKAKASQPKPFPEPAQKAKTPEVGAAVGIPAAQLTADQKASLVKLLEHYAGRMSKEVGERELKAVRDAGIDKVHFAYHGSVEEGQKRSYRIQGPTFVVEFLNEQADSAGNQANHIHSAWRRIVGDFGL